MLHGECHGRALQDLINGAAGVRAVAHDGEAGLHQPGKVQIVRCALDLRDRVAQPARVLSDSLPVGGEVAGIDQHGQADHRSHGAHHLQFAFDGFAGRGPCPKPPEGQRVDQHCVPRLGQRRHVIVLRGRQLATGLPDQPGGFLVDPVGFSEAAHESKGCCHPRADQRTVKSIGIGTDLGFDRFDVAQDALEIARAIVADPQPGPGQRRHTMLAQQLGQGIGAGVGPDGAGSGMPHRAHGDAADHHLEVQLEPVPLVALDQGGDGLQAPFELAQSFRPRACAQGFYRGPPPCIHRLTRAPRERQVMRQQLRPGVRLVDEVRR